MSKQMLPLALILLALTFCSSGCRAGNPYGMQTEQPYNQQVMQQQVGQQGYGNQQRTFAQELPQFGRQVGRRFVDLAINRGLNRIVGGIF